MAISRYRKVAALEGTFSYKLNPITKKRRNLIFYNSLKMRALNDDSFEDLEVIDVAFKSTDTLMGLAQTFFGEPSYWWVIALINNVGSERDIAIGQSLVILTPVSSLLAEYDL